MGFVDLPKCTVEKEPNKLRCFDFLPEIQFLTNNEMEDENCTIKNLQKYAADTIKATQIYAQKISTLDNQIS